MLVIFLTFIVFKHKFNWATVYLERYPSKPYIKEGYPGNITVLVNDTVQLSCPPVSDLEPYLYWVRPSNYSIKDAEVGPSDAPVPAGDIIEVFNLDVGGGYVFNGSGTPQNIGHIKCNHIIIFKARLHRTI